MFLPSDCLEKLKCCLCHQLLSIFPIFIKKNDPQSSICGRCQVPNNADYLRFEIYENLVATVQFPCINNEFGCIENLVPENMERHEAICSYRFKFCTLYERNKCKWSGPCNQLFEHYQTDHIDLFVDNNQFDFNISEHQRCAKILKYYDELFFLQFRFDRMLRQLKCSIIPLGLSKTTKHYGGINLTTKNASLIHNFPIEGSFSKLFNTNIENLYIENGSAVTGTIIVADAQAKLDYYHKQNQEISKLMKCCRCKNILFNSVYNCGSRQYTCNDCNATYWSGDAMHDQAVEQNSKIIYHKCPNSGCNFIVDRYDFEIHRLCCSYEPIQCCFIDCKRQPQRRHFIGHIFKKHRETIVEFDQFVELSFDIESKTCGQTSLNITVFGRLCKLIYRYDFPKLKVIIKNTDLLGKTCDFRFDIRVFDKDKVERIRMQSASYINYNMLHLHKDQINHLIFENTLLFKINILK